MSVSTPRQSRPQLAYDRDNAFFRDGLESGCYLVQRCASCLALRNPPRPMCPHCLSLDWRAIAVSGHGEIYSYAVHHHPALPGIATPNVVVLVDLAEGVRAIGNLLDTDPAEVRIGASVRLSIRAGDDGSPLPQWTLVEAGR